MEKNSDNPSRPPIEASSLHLDYDAVCGRLLVTSPRGGFVIFHGVPIDAYIRLRFSARQETYLRDRFIPDFSFVCSSACWPRTYPPAS